LGSEDMSLITEARPIFWVLFGILFVFSIGGIYFNGLAGTGATLYGLKIQAFSAVLYLIYIYIVVEFTNGGLVWAWASEIFYWIIMLFLIISYLQSRRWLKLKF